MLTYTISFIGFIKLNILSAISQIFAGLDSLSDLELYTKPYREGEIRVGPSAPGHRV